MATINGTPPQAAEPEPITGTVALRPPSAAAATGAQRRKAEPIDGALLWLLVRKYLRHYVAWPSDAVLDLVTAWIFHAAARDRDDTGMGQLIWRASPRLLFTSRFRRSGKSTALDLVLILTRSRRGKMPKVTAAKFAKLMGKQYETACLDEAKVIFGAGSAQLELQGCLLAGYTRRASHEVANHSYDLFGSVAYAAKENLITETRGDTIGDLLDRSFIIYMTPPSRPKPEIDEQAEDDGDMLGRALIAWTDYNREALKQAARAIAAEDAPEVDGEEDEPEPGEAVDLRRGQISRPLRAVARVIGPGCERDILAALEELAGGTAGAEARELMTELKGRRWAQDDGEDYADEPPATPPVTTAFAAGYSITCPGTRPVAVTIPGTWASLDDAQAACEELASEQLPWGQGETGTWGATIHPSGPDGPEVVYAVVEHAG